MGDPLAGRRRPRPGHRRLLPHDAGPHPALRPAPAEAREDPDPPRRRAGARGRRGGRDPRLLPPPREGKDPLRPRSRPDGLPVPAELLRPGNGARRARGPAPTLSVWLERGSGRASSDRSSPCRRARCAWHAPATASTCSAFSRGDPSSPARGASESRSSRDASRQGAVLLPGRGPRGGPPRALRSLARGPEPPLHDAPCRPPRSSSTPAVARPRARPRRLLARSTHRAWQDVTVSRTPPRDTESRRTIARGASTAPPPALVRRAGRPTGGQAPSLR